MLQHQLEQRAVEPEFVTVAALLQNPKNHVSLKDWKALKADSICSQAVALDSCDTETVDLGDLGGAQADIPVVRCHSCGDDAFGLGEDLRLNENGRVYPPAVVSVSALGQDQLECRFDELRFVLREPSSRARQSGVEIPMADARVRISAIVDACFRLIVDGETAPSVTRWGSAQVLV